MRLLITTQIVDRTHSNLGFFHSWIQEFAKHCDEVHVICLQEGEHELPSNVFIHSLGKERGVNRVGRVMRFYRYLWSLMDSYDAVFVHMNPEYIVLAGPLWRIKRKKVVLWYVHKSITIWLQIGAFFADKILTASSGSIKLKSAKVSAVGHGIDTNRFKPVERTASAAMRILSVGRIARSKGLLEILGALEVLRARNIPFELLIVGAPLTGQEHVYNSEVKEEILKRDLSAHVHMPGPIENGDLPELFSRTDALVNVSTTGGYDKVVLEALACKIPAVSSSAPFRELLEPYGLFIESTKPDTIAHVITHAAKSDVSALSEQVRKGNSLEHLITSVINFLRV